MSQISVTNLSDGRLQFFVVFGPGLPPYTAWQADPDPSVQWVPLELFAQGLPSNGGVTAIWAHPRADGSTQVWAIDQNGGTVLSTEKVSTDANASWSDWGGFQPTVAADSIATETLEDGRLQLFAITGTGLQGSPYQVQSCWETGGPGTYNSTRRLFR
jgi:hypothetical protein